MGLDSIAQRSLTLPPHLDIIWLKENEEIPCDVLLLATPEPSGVCYIQTTNLDGESDLKLRQALPATAALSTDRIHRFRVQHARHTSFAH